ncbi:Cobalamin biosynthesis protein CbiB [Loigolactobacillus coryniformis subsp. coryniformis CECT 5711]|uniref:Cobalamin biosynthesis protein CobD n=1 Tax=Loigolactobacillus coryniformis subsp. coryniformis CECT 5711 TaxID=1185325 RepID=J3JCJ5_9LACO|nr:Cobalamin biosynthesis protein CbiB [Loigolactobacillus coryniformis subsp. coryniformis CECT 5711]
MISMIGLAFVLDLLLGDPYSWPHPVKVMGQAIAAYVKKFDQTTRSARQLFWLGVLLWFVIVGGTAIIAGAIMGLTQRWFWLHYVVGVYLCYTTLSIRGLAHEGRKIQKSLQAQRLTQARQQVGMIVGRDTQQLSAEAVCKATIETIAENTSDGVIAPLFYLFIGGPVLGLVYKAVNTLDSMVGYRNQKYRNIGRFSAQLDDIFNWLPARLTWLFLLAASWLLRLNSRGAWQIGRRDRRQHLSPNSALSESVVAGALDLRLGGPHQYFGERVDKPFIGRTDARPASSADIGTTNRMLYVSAILGLLFFAGCRWLLI